MAPVEPWDAAWGAEDGRRSCPLGGKKEGAVSRSQLPWYGFSNYKLARPRELKADRRHAEALQRRSTSRELPPICQVHARPFGAEGPLRVTPGGFCAMKQISHPFWGVAEE